MPTTTYQIDKYCLRIYANDLRGSVTRWGTKVILFYSEGKHVASGYFAREGFTAPDAQFSGGKIYFHAPGYQYQPAVDMLRNEEPVFISWILRSDPGEPNDGIALLYTGTEPVGEGEYKDLDNSIIK
jgi:hypothetical protein